MANTYWNSNGKHQSLVDKLNELIPCEGSVPKAHTSNKALEKFRNASNCYYDLYNNGLCNRARQFAKVFGIASSHYRNYGRQWSYSDTLYNKTEERMDAIIAAAATEQNIVA